MEAETIEQAQARHRRELKELQGRITNKKKNATKKTRKGVNDECTELERALREKQAGEIAALSGAADDEDAEDETRQQDEQDETLAAETSEKLQIAKEDTQPEQQPPSQEAGGGGPGKKRNRQKERLARRAAEQEAAAARAEEEASSMTNHRAIENAYMRRKMEAEGLVEQDIDPDGHCLFSAVADQLQTQLSMPLTAGLAKEGGSPGEGEGEGKAKEPAYKTVRKVAAAFMAEHEDDFAPFVFEEPDFGAYVARMRDTAAWGGEPELMALARAYGVGIRVVQDGRTEEIGEGGGKLVWLAYYRHGYGLGEHYNSLRRK